MMDENMIKFICSVYAIINNINDEMINKETEKLAIDEYFKNPFFNARCKSLLSLAKQVQ
jgi:hypothetical protein